MPYSLINRFRGALIGGFVGETSTLPDRQDQAREAIYCAEIATSAQSLISTQSNSPLATEADMAIAATIPIALFFHDDAQTLRQTIMDATPQAIQDAGFVVSESIAYALQPQMEPLRLLPKLVQLLPDETLSQKLRQVQKLLKRGDSLAIAVKKLGDAQQLEVAIALAFYCWLSTAEQFQLSVLRVHRIPNASPLTLLLTGAFSGALNGQMGIPQAWLTAGAVRSDFQQMETLAEQLLATWSGCLQVGLDGMDKVAIASPGILRPR